MSRISGKSTCDCTGCNHSTESFGRSSGHKLNHAKQPLNQLPDRDQYGRIESAHKRYQRQTVITPNNLHKCDYPGCEKQFLNANSLLGHRLNHAKKRKITAKTN